MYWVLITLLLTGPRLSAQDPAHLANGYPRGVVEFTEIWPAGLPFTTENVRSWALAHLKRRPGPHAFFRVMTGPDRAELGDAKSRNSHDANYAKRDDPKYPMAQLTAIGRSASLIIQVGTGFAREYVIQGAKSPLVLEVNGSRYRILHVDLFPTRGPLAATTVFLQSENRDTTLEDGIALWRLLAGQIPIPEIRVLIRPDAWSDDSLFPARYRFILDFGQEYLFKPRAPSANQFYLQPKLQCVPVRAGISCGRSHIVFENLTFPR